MKKKKTKIKRVFQIKKTKVIEETVYIVDFYIAKIFWYKIISNKKLLSYYLYIDM